MSAVALAAKSGAAGGLNTTPAYVNPRPSAALPAAGGVSNALAPSMHAPAPAVAAHPRMRQRAVGAYYSSGNLITAANTPEAQPHPATLIVDSLTWPWSGGAAGFAAAAALPPSLTAEQHAHASGYLSLLAESSTCAGGMQRHLLRMLARTAGRLTKAICFLHDPLNPLTGEVAKKGADMALRSVDAARSSVASVSSIDDFDVHDVLNAPEDVNPAHSRLLALLLSMILSGAVSATGVGDAVGSAALMAAQAVVPPDVVRAISAAAGQANDADAGAVETQSEQVVSPFASYSIGQLQPQQPTGSGGAVPLTQGQAQASDGPQRRLVAALSLQRAPSLAPALSAGLAHAASGEAGLAGAMGMAASTAMRVLRADARLGMADLDNVVESVLDSINETLDEDGDGRMATARSDELMPNLPHLLRGGGGGGGSTRSHSALVG